MALTNVQYDEIMRTYDENQIRRAHLIRTRKEALYKQVPRIAEIDREIAHSSVTQAKRMLDGDNDALTALSAHIARLTDEKKKLLLSHGINDDYLNPPYQCPDCKDTGYIGTKQCHCFKQKAIELVYTQSDLSEMLEKENFKTFSLEYYSDQDIDPQSGISALEYAKRAESRCFQFARTFDHHYENLLLQGDTGTGKTFLTHCVAKELLDTGHSVIYLTAHKLFDLLAKNAFRKDIQNLPEYQNIFSCDLLIIDDLGTESANSLTVSQFFVCLNERIRNRKSMLISTNLRLSDLATIYSERISSRIVNGFTILKLYGEDIRIKKKLTN